LIEEEKILKKPRIFYGYWIVAAAFIFAFLQAGSGYYAFPLFVKSFQNDFGWGRGEIMVAVTIMFLGLAVTSPFVGRLVDRYGARNIMAIGAFGQGLSFLLLSQTHNLWYLYIGWAGFGIADAAGGLIPATAVVSNWFKKRRGTAIGIMGIGVGAGGFVLAPLIGGFVIPQFGWRDAFLFLAILNFLLIPLALLVIKMKPEDMRLHPDNIVTNEKVSGVKVSHSEGLDLKTALATTAFWLIAVSFFLSQFSEDGVVQNQVTHLQDIGFPLATAASALGGVGLGSAAGKFIFGWLCDRIPAKYACTLGISLQAIAIIIMINIGSTSPVWVLWLYSITMGLGIGSWLPSMSMLTSTNFGMASYGAIFGAISFAQWTGNAVGPLVAGYMYDVMKTYHAAFIIFASLYLISIPAILAVRRPRPAKI
jgi:MFS family permease